MLSASRETHSDLQCFDLIERISVQDRKAHVVNAFRYILCAWQEMKRHLREEGTTYLLHSPLIIPLVSVTFDQAKA